MTTREYLGRIGIGDACLPPTVETLRRLQRAHLFSVPYENLDILSGKPLSLGVEDLYQKIVVNRRGGYCFELNELFGWLLREIGYEVTDYFARFLSDEAEIPMRRHHVLKTRIPGEETAYLCDVGVGTGSPNEPMRMTLFDKQAQDNGVYRFVWDDFLGWILERRKADAWRRVFSFTEEKQLPVDFVAASFYCEKSPDSIFNKSSMVAMRTPGGRITLDGDEFRRFEGDQVTVIKVIDPLERAGMLKSWFGIDWSAGDGA